MTSRLYTKPLAMIACGDRNWTDKDKIIETLVDYDPDILIEGEARGADKLSRIVAEEELGLCVEDGTIEPFSADWNQFRKAAGPIRNRAQLKRLLELRDEGYEIAVVAFHEDIENSKGTKDMVTISEKAGVEVEIVD